VSRDDVHRFEEEGMQSYILVERWGQKKARLELCIGGDTDMRSRPILGLHHRVFLVLCRRETSLWTRASVLTDCDARYSIRLIPVTF
jgi:hypothetical protein